MSKRLSLRRLECIAYDICMSDRTRPLACSCWKHTRKLWRRALAKRKAKRGWRPGR